MSYNTTVESCTERRGSFSACNKLKARRADGEVGTIPDDPYYKSGTHKAWAAAVMSRAPHDESGPLCENCLRYGRHSHAVVAHHIKPRLEFPELAADPSNGIALCASCHNAAHPEKGGSRKTKHPPLSRRRFYEGL